MAGPKHAQGVRPIRLPHVCQRSCACVCACAICCRRIRALFRARWCDLCTCARVWLRVYVLVCFLRSASCGVLFARLLCAYVCLTGNAQEWDILDASPDKTLPNADCPTTISRECSRLAFPLCQRCLRSLCRAARHYSPTKVWYPEISAHRTWRTSEQRSIRTHGLVAMMSAQHAEGRQFDPGWVYGSEQGGPLCCILASKAVWPSTFRPEQPEQKEIGAHDLPRLTEP